jgi:tRNA(Ile)-lysidine synthase
MGPGFEDKVAAFAAAYELIGPEDRVLVAVSGGADSVALLHALSQLRSGGGLRCDLVCAHVNHHLRGPASDADERFVQSQASVLGLPFAVTSLDVAGFAGQRRLSIETAARVLRMQALLDMANQSQCHVIACGHQKNDNAETVIHRLLRGTGLRGLGGIWPSRSAGEGVRLVRPLLCVTRHEVVEYLRDRGLAWQEDATNADCRFTRNAIRRLLLPALQQEATSSLMETLSCLALSSHGLYARTIASEVDRVQQAAVQSTGDGGLSLDVETLKAEPPYVQAELIRQALARLGCGERDLAEVHYAGLLALVGARHRSQGVSLPGGFSAQRRGAALHISHHVPATAHEPGAGPIQIQVPGPTRTGTCLVEAVIVPMDEALARRIRTNRCPTTEWLDCDQLNMPLVLREPRPGDRFRPLGQSHDKKVGRFLLDARISRDRRDQVVVVEDHDKIVWVCPVRISDLVKVTAATRRVVQISIRQAEGEEGKTVGP